MTQQPDRLDFLKGYSTTQLESAVALFKLRARNDGVTLPGLQQRFPALGRLVGYAVTCVFSTDADDARGRRENVDYWNFLHHLAGPKVVIALDASAQAASGSTFGRLNANIHRALGCRGVITNGGVRDIDDFQKLGLHVFSAIYWPKPYFSVASGWQTNSEQFVTSGNRLAPRSSLPMRGRPVRTSIASASA